MPIRSEYGANRPHRVPGDRFFRPPAARPPNLRCRHEARSAIIDAFREASEATTERLRDNLPRFVGWIEFHPEHPDQTDDLKRGPVMRLQNSSARASALDTGAEEIVSVMTRLGPADLAVVDTLITAGIASSRAEALRWTVGRIRENPAYEQLQQRVNEINELKTQF
jgi:hypothetical protein